MKLVYLHGVGDGGVDKAWLAALNRQLIDEGIAEIAEGDVIAPNYSDLLALGGDDASLPRTTPVEGDSKSARAEFQARQLRGLRSIGRDPSAQAMGFGGVVDASNPAWVGGAAKMVPDAAKRVVAQVNHYVNSPGLRAAVVRRVIASLPGSGEVVLVGHSLGSAVAIDVITRLPGELSVQRFVTIGSPASSKIFSTTSRQLIANFPYARVGDWINFFSPRDPVTRGSGLSTVFSDVRDVRVNIGKTAHSSDRYFGNPAVARAVGKAFHTSIRAPRRTTRVTTALTDETASKILEIHYNYALESSLQKSTMAKFAEAVRIRREDLVAQIWEANAEGLPLPREFHRLAEGELPVLPDYWTTSQLVEELTILALSNTVSPFEIEVKQAVRIEAVRSVLGALGRQPAIADEISTAIKQVHGCLGSNGSRWGKVAAVGAGVALIALGPISLAAVAPAGLAGGAALTSGLAALGPGGMVGGIATVSGLTSTGAAVTTAASVRKHSAVNSDAATFIVRTIAAWAQCSLNLDYDEDLWAELTAMHGELSAEVNLLAPISDSDSPSLKALHDQINVITKLVDFLEDHKMSGAVLVDEA